MPRNRWRLGLRPQTPLGKLTFYSAPPDHLAGFWEKGPHERDGERGGKGKRGMDRKESRGWGIAPWAQGG